MTSSELSSVIFNSLQQYSEAKMYGISQNADLNLANARTALVYKWLLDSGCTLTDALNCAIEKFCNKPQIKTMCCSEEAVDPTCLGVITFNCALIDVEDVTIQLCTNPSISINIIQ